MLEVGYANESETGEHRKNGYEIEVWNCRSSTGAPRESRARRCLYLQALASHRAARDQRRSPKCAKPIDAYRTAYDIARHYRDEVVPLRKRIAEENVLRYNGMLIGVFELLADCPRAGRAA